MRGIHTCCPEAPSTINITQNVVEMDGDTAFFVDERFTGAQVVNGVLTLSHVPYAASSVQLALNSGVQRLGVDFIVVGNKLQFVSFAPQASDILHVRYFSTETGAVTIPSGTELPTGFTLGYSAANIPDGWLLMSAATTVTNGEATALLFAFLTANPHLINETPGEGVVSYTLKAIQTPYYVDGQIMAGNTIIKI
jgi:hypothetical protein